MRIHLIAVGNRMPAWVSDGYGEYAGRLNQECVLCLHEIPAEKRGKNADLEGIKRREGKQILEVLPKGSHVVALDVDGKMWSTEQLAQRLEEWMQDGKDVALLVGGPEGLSDECMARANQRWSLSALTLPHPMVRVVVAEQLYRAWSVTKGHPYHR